MPCWETARAVQRMTRPGAVDARDRRCQGPSMPGAVDARDRRCQGRSMTAHRLRLRAGCGSISGMEVAHKGTAIPGATPGAALLGLVVIT